jgi:AcrR family transcriptional regulator
MDSVEPEAAPRLQAAAVQSVLDGLSPHAAVSDFQPLDSSELLYRRHAAFDRDGASEAKRERVQQTASRLFNRKGIDSTSLEEIAAQLGATKRTVYHHLGNKQALAAALHAVALVHSDETLAPLSPLVGFATLAPRARAKMNDYGLRVSSDYRGVLREGIREGSMREVDVAPRTIMMAGLTSWLVHEDVSKDPTRRAQIAREVATVTMAGLATGTAVPPSAA